jgi:hypothetical protein
MNDIEIHYHNQYHAPERLASGGGAANGRAV